jgi:hypothetical protein
MPAATTFLIYDPLAGPFDFTQSLPLQRGPGEGLGSAKVQVCRIRRGRTPENSGAILTISQFFQEQAYQRKADNNDDDGRKNICACYGKTDHQS